MKNQAVRSHPCNAVPHLLVRRDDGGGCDVLPCDTDSLQPLELLLVLTAGRVRHLLSKSQRALPKLTAETSISGAPMLHAYMQQSCA